jgi:hypothetical protein
MRSGRLSISFAKRDGIPLSPYLAFGETITLFDTDDLGLSFDWPKALREKLQMRRLYPECWPSASALARPSPKILILDENVFHRMHDVNVDDVITEVAGVISTNSGLMSHLATLSRGLGMGAITCPLSEQAR